LIDFGLHFGAQNGNKRDRQKRNKIIAFQGDPKAPDYGRAPDLIDRVLVTLSSKTALSLGRGAFLEDLGMDRPLEKLILFTFQRQSSLTN